MTPYDAARRVVAPRGVRVPARFPGGVWGPPPCALVVEWDSNGVPRGAWGDDPVTSMVPNGVAPSSGTRDRHTATAECAWPQTWWVSITIDTPRVIDPPPPIVTLVEWEMEVSVESATSTRTIRTPWYADVPSATYDHVVAAHHIAIRPHRLLGLQQSAMAGVNRRIAVTWHIGMRTPPTEAW